jgi:hypothetical protein
MHYCFTVFACYPESHGLKSCGAIDWQLMYSYLELKTQISLGFKMFERIGIM